MLFSVYQELKFPSFRLLGFYSAFPHTHFKVYTTRTGNSFRLIRHKIMLIQNLLYLDLLDSTKYGLEANKIKREHNEICTIAGSQ